MKITPMIDLTPTKTVSFRIFSLISAVANIFDLPFRVKEILVPFTKR